MKAHEKQVLVLVCTLSTLQEGNWLSPLGQVPTSYHANTAILIPELNQYYVAVNHHGNTDAMVQVYKILP